MTRGIALSLLALALVGCGAAAPAASNPPVASPNTTAPATPAPTPVATPTPLPTPDASAIVSAYLAFASSVTAGSKAANAAIDAAATDAELASAYADYAALLGGFSSQLKAIAFPHDILPEVENQRAAYDALGVEFAKLAADLNYDPGTKIDDAAAMVNDSGAAIRTFLGLPPAPPA